MQHHSSNSVGENLKIRHIFLTYFKDIQFQFTHPIHLFLLSTSCQKSNFCPIFIQLDRFLGTKIQILFQWIFMWKISAVDLKILIGNFALGGQKVLKKRCKVWCKLMSLPSKIISGAARYCNSRFFNFLTK